MMGDGAAKTGSSLIRRGKEAEDSSFAKTEGRNATLLSEFWEAVAGETKVRQKPLMEAVDIVQ